jgi:alkylation response protein AidB-like acyl-CoA dehydrogenase
MIQGRVTPSPAADERRGVNSPNPEDDAELEALAPILETAISANDLGPFWHAFRRSTLPFIGAAHEGDVAGLFGRCFTILHRLGGISPATALAVENHYYVSSAIATLPPFQDPALDLRRKNLTDAIFGQRLLVANTNSKVHGEKLGAFGTCARRENGGFRVSGTAAYTSMATRGDVLVFITQLEGEGPALFVVSPMQDNPAVEIGPYLFPDAMVESDTRKITFRDLQLPAASLIAGGEGQEVSALLAFEMAWHQLLIPALYLGAAARALEETRVFLRGTRGRDDSPLSELDGMAVDVGRVVIGYRSAVAAVHAGGRALAAVKVLPRDVAALDSALDMAGIAKYVGTRCAERTVTETRRIIGARSFLGGHAVERLSREVMFGPLGPDVNAVIERRQGRRALAEGSFLKSV